MPSCTSKQKCSPRAMWCTVPVHWTPTPTSRPGHWPGQNDCHSRCLAWQKRFHSALLEIKTYDVLLSSRFAGVHGQDHASPKANESIISGNIRVTASEQSLSAFLLVVAFSAREPQASCQGNFRRSGFASDNVRTTAHVIGECRRTQWAASRTSRRDPST